MGEIVRGRGLVLVRVVIHIWVDGASRAHRHPRRGRDGDSVSLRVPVAVLVVMRTAIFLVEGGDRRRLELDDVG